MTNNKKPITRVIYDSSITYPTPPNLTYFWNFGSLAIWSIIVQIITGIFLAMHYVPDPKFAFASIEHIMRDVPAGWLLRYIHSNGASFFFLVVYIHMCRSILYTSYVRPRHVLWYSGSFIFIIMMATAFLGYVLPWAQMSYWAATVITNLFSIVPFFGQDLVNWLWGGFAVDAPTLTRFFSLHYFLPFVLIAFIFAHVIILHETGSNEKLAAYLPYPESDMIPFHPYYTVKDILGIISSLIAFFSFLYFVPNLLGHPDNYLPGDPCTTPAHIVPEWYFLPFYALLRTVPNKSLGVLTLVASLLCLIFLPFIAGKAYCFRSGIWRPIYKITAWLWIGNFVVLGLIGSKPIEQPFYSIGIICTIIYFSFFLMLFVLKFFEKQFMEKRKQYIMKLDREILEKQERNKQKLETKNK